MTELRDPPASDDFEWVNSWAHGAPPAAVEKPKTESAQPPTRAQDTGAQDARAQDTRAQDMAEPIPQKPIDTPARVVVPPKSPDAIAHPTEIAAQKSSVTARPSFADRIAQASRKRAPDADQFVHPATRRFFAALRTPIPTQESEAPVAPVQPPDHDVQPILAVTPTSTVTTPSEPAPEAAPAAAEVRDMAPAVTPATDATHRPANIESAEAGLVPDADQLARDIAEIECAREALLEPAPFTITDPRKPRSRFLALRHAESVPILVGSVVGATLLIVFGAAASLISLR